MTKSRIFIAPVFSIRDTGPSFSFVFSDDIEKWIRSTKSKHSERQRAYDAKRRAKVGRGNQP